MPDKTNQSYIHINQCSKSLNTRKVVDSQVTILIWGDLETTVESPMKLSVQFTEEDRRKILKS